MQYAELYSDCTQWKKAPLMVWMMIVFLCFVGEPISPIAGSPLVVWFLCSAVRCSLLTWLWMRVNSTAGWSWVDWMENGTSLGKMGIWLFVWDCYHTGKGQIILNPEKQRCTLGNLKASHSAQFFSSWFSLWHFLEFALIVSLPCHLPSPFSPSSNCSNELLSVLISFSLSFMSSTTCVLIYHGKDVLWLPSTWSPRHHCLFTT